MEYLVVIPARYASSRLPGKPLMDISGIPMIVRTYRQCIKAVLPELVIVATDDERIKNVCEGEGIRVVMTSADCLTGTDRVAEVARHIHVNTYINVQGDEPLFNPADLSALIHVAMENPSDVVNGYCPITEEAAFRSSTVPKVIVRPDGRLLYMSRGAIPTNKKLGFAKAWRQVCAYAFPRAALEHFSERTNKTALEEIEDIEILRFLELGWDVKMVLMSTTSVAVDNSEDLETVRKLMRNHE
jgi:3-deoxy-manno-octulosonate cytidylyltransferase (CMP-KDO synthetase)